ncbi:hypothetical protein BH20ACI2_BH20ACI2_03580 [soil metagenome]
MKLPLYIALFLLIMGSNEPLMAQPRESALSKTRPAAVRFPEAGQRAVVIDETLSILRTRPSLYSESIQRMRRGRKVQIQAVAEADGVKFYRITAPPAASGWVQADAVFGKFRSNDEHRLAALVQALSGFEQIEVAVQFFEIYPDSKLRPSILLLFGDLLEEAAPRLSRDALSRLSRKEMAASGAPLHSYYLNFVSLDRYRRLGVRFLFNSGTRQYHYDGASWREITTKYPSSPEAAEAEKRLDALRVKLGMAPSVTN